MNTLGRCVPRALCAALLTAVCPLAASAQGTQGPRGQGPMIVERIESGFLVAPEVKVTRFDRRTSELVGVYGGWLADQTVFIGAGGYWLANRSRDRALGYGGLVIGVMPRSNRTVSFGVKGLVGGGRATTVQTVTYFPGPLVRTQTPGSPAPSPVPFPVPIPVETAVRVRDSFFVAEPEANVIVNLGRRFHLSAGAGYRFVGRQRGVRNSLNGATGSVALQIGS